MGLGFNTLDFFMKKNNKLILILVFLFLIFFLFSTFFKGKRIEKNKALAVGVITKVNSNSIVYKFLVLDSIYIGHYSGRGVHPELNGRKNIVIYNSLVPQENLILLNYSLDQNYKLNNDLNLQFNKDSISVPFWKLSLNLSPY